MFNNFYSIMNKFDVHYFSNAMNICTNMGINETNLPILINSK